MSELHQEDQPKTAAETEAETTQEEHGLLADTIDAAEKAFSSAVKTGEDIVHYAAEKIGEFVGAKEPEGGKAAEEPAPHHHTEHSSAGIMGATKSMMVSATSTVSSLLGLGTATHEEGHHEKKCTNPDCKCVDCRCGRDGECKCDNKGCACVDCPTAGQKNKKCQNAECTCENCQCAPGECTCGK